MSPTKDYKGAKDVEVSDIWGEAERAGSVQPRKEKTQEGYYQCV